ncbi:MAG: endonuclease/exonuclease/phosphatase family protein, partial [Lysobacteraceae bacterium]
MTSRSTLRPLALLCSLAMATALAGCVQVRIHGDPARAAPASVVDGDFAAEAEAAADAEPAAMAAKRLRVATYNTSLNDDAEGGLIRRLESGDPSARSIATMLQRVRPDLVLLNEFDYDAAGRAADLFQRDYLERAQGKDLAPLRYPHRYLAPVNTGVPSGLDLDGNGRVATEGRARGDDAWGFGLHSGQYGMLVLSKYPIDTAAVRTFRLLKWSAMPDAARPVDPRARKFFHPDPVWNALRLSSKSHWDVPVDTPLGRVHFLVAHPTPPVFDGPEDRNGARNADEIGLWRAYLDDAPADRAWLCDDAGRCGGLPAGERFVIAGDMNNDPVDGDGRHAAILG